MRFIAFIIVILSQFFWGSLIAKSAQSLPKTHVTLNAHQGCAVQVAAWISPSCAHCADYFVQDIPKIAAMPGFCLDLHFLPNLYLLDMPAAILIWSQGPENAMHNAEIFLKNQSEWLDISASREKIDDPRRAQDIEKFLKDMQTDKSKNVSRIKAYLDASDIFLYLKMFALRHFSIEHLERYLPKGSVDVTLSMVLLKDLPRKNGAVINFAPAFTNVSGQLLPDTQLSSGILTPSVAEGILAEHAKTSGPFVPKTVTQKPAPVVQPIIAKKAEHIIDADGAQDADEVPLKAEPAKPNTQMTKPTEQHHESSLYDNDTLGYESDNNSPYDDDVAESLDDLDEHGTPNSINHENELSDKLRTIIDAHQENLDGPEPHHDGLVN